MAEKEIKFFYEGQARGQPLLPGSILENNPGPRQPERIKEGEASPCLQLHRHGGLEPRSPRIFRTPPLLGAPPLKPGKAGNKDAESKTVIIYID